MSFSRVNFVVDWIERQCWCCSPLISVCYIDKRMHLVERGIGLKHRVDCIGDETSCTSGGSRGVEDTLESGRTRIGSYNTKVQKGARVFSNLSLLRPKIGIADAGRMPLRANLSHLKGAEFQVAFIRVS
jgi:hypothetical protein